MRYTTLFIILGLIIAIVPFTGFPGYLKTFFIVVSGLVIAGLSFHLKMKARLDTSSRQNNSDTLVS